MATVAIIDYGVGNLRSVEKAFAATGHHAVVSGDRNDLREAERLVLPGVGAFGACMAALHDRGLDQVVRECVEDGTPLLGLCVGMQLLFDKSEEFGSTSGFGFLRGHVRRFDDKLVVPHVGWNQIHQRRKHELLAGIPDDSFVYFVHSYLCEPDNAEVVIGETYYGSNYASVVASGNVCGVQFHPEKSQLVGLTLLANFASTSCNTL